MTEADRFPPRWPLPGTSAWGDDRFGLWIELELAGVVQRYRWLEPGEPAIGSPNAEAARMREEGPQHRVRLTRGTRRADRACTQGLWRSVMGGDPSMPKGDDCLPVENVSWEDVQSFMQLIRRLLPAGVEAMLPTEAQWECACRTGTNTPWRIGANIAPELANHDGTDPYPVGAPGHYRGMTVRSKTLPANGSGLYELRGDVWEWCADCQRGYGDASAGDPQGPRGGSRLQRGGPSGGGARHGVSAHRRIADEP
jgi:formylglycine-generating enzyme